MHGFPGIDQLRKGMRDEENAFVFSFLGRRGIFYGRDGSCSPDLDFAHLYCCCVFMRSIAVRLEFRKLLMLLLLLRKTLLASFISLLVFAMPLSCRYLLLLRDVSA